MRTFGLFLGILLAVPVWCQPTLADASLEQLLDTPVTSVSRKEQKLLRTAAAVFVISRDDIRCSGATSIPDLLRMVPGLDVAQIDANSWAISIRGFGQRYSSKLLVLVDGRSVYTPSFSGVHWDQLNLLPGEIERIEVIRGPGATVWGANAMNGVIDIITRSSKSTKGGRVSLSAGSDPQANFAMRYGDSAGASGAYRAYVNASRIPHRWTQDGLQANDGWSRINGGFRSDWDLAGGDSLTVEGELFAQRGGHTRVLGFEPTPFGQTLSESTDSAGGNLLGTWTHTSNGGSETSVRSYFDTYRRNDIATIERMSSADLEIQNRFALGGRHEIVWGGGFRETRSGVEPGGQVLLHPLSRTDPTYSFFLQDEVSLATNLWFTVGSKIEHNAFTGFEYEPSVRIVWTPTSRSALWAATSRAIRQPSRQETGIDIQLAELPLDPGTVLTVQLYGNPNFRSEELRDLEVGYRAAWSRRISFDVDLFLSSYRHLSTHEPGPVVIRADTFPVRIESPQVYANLGRAKSKGAEASLTWEACSRWRLAVGYAWLDLDPSLEPPSTDVMSLQLMMDDPPQSFQIRSSLNLGRGVEWGQSLYGTSRLADRDVPGHVRLDSRLAWKIGERTEISVVGQNLLRPRTLEFTDGFQIVPSFAGRSVFGRITWAF